MAQPIHSRLPPFATASSTSSITSNGAIPPTPLAASGAPKTTASSAPAISRPPTTQLAPRPMNGSIPTSFPPTTSATSVSNTPTPLSTTPRNGPGVDGIGKGVPAFLVKLYSMINDPQTDELIYWSEDGKSFFIPNSTKFGQTLLPQFFKHANFTSFVRQLNMYGFKKVPHLQAAVLSSFAPAAAAGSSRSATAGPSTQPAAAQQPELWEFNNPKFMRGHPELLGSITRKKSAKEIAAAQAAHGAAAHSTDKHDHAMSDGEKATAGKHREDDPDHDMDGEPVVRPDGLGVGGTTTAGPPKPAKTADSESAADSSVSRALTLMHATHSSLEKELAALKSSNEMLWRQWMLSREEQIKSEKKVDNIMRFLAGQFGGMNMNMAIDDGPADGARNDGVPSGIGNATVPTSPRLRRLGSSKLIEHGVHGLGDSPSDVMSFDGDALSPSKDADDGEIWEFDDNGQLVKLKTSKIKAPTRPLHRSSTPTRARTFANLPNTANKASAAQSSASSSPNRFVNLDGSPEEKSLASFDSGNRTREGSPVINPAVSNGLEQQQHQQQIPAGALFPAAPVKQTVDATPLATSPTTLQPTLYNALTPYQPSMGSLAALAGNLDPALLQLPLGALLGSTAGAQLLASLSQIAAHGLAQNAQAAAAPVQTANVTPYNSTPSSSTNAVASSSSSSVDHPQSWQPARPVSAAVAAPQSDPQPQPQPSILAPLTYPAHTNGQSASNEDPLRWLNGSATANGIEELPSLGTNIDMDLLNPAMLGTSPHVGHAEVDWNDPEMAQLLSHFDNPSLTADMSDPHNVLGGATANANAQADALSSGQFAGYIPADGINDKHLDFENLFGGSLTAHDDGERRQQDEENAEMVGTPTAESFKEPTRKKRKTDDRR